MARDWGNFFLAEDFKARVPTIAQQDVADKANAIIREELKGVRILKLGKYEISQYQDVIDDKDEHSICISKDDGEGMQIKEETMDKIWKEYF